MTFSHHHAPARRDVDMTQGSITRHLIQFALPLLAGNVFQQLYNMVDTWVVGNFVSNEAFSAVGTVGPIVNMLIGFFMGLSSGAGVVISQYYGAHRPEKVRDTVHTAMVLTLVLCAVFTALGLALIPAMLDLMNTPAEVLPESTAYLSIYFSGITGLLIYNMGSGILRAVGDSRRPFYFLVVSAVLNTVLDLLFVIKFHMGVEGVAYATIIAQAVSAVLTLWVLMGAEGGIRLELHALRFTWSVLRQIVAFYIELSRNTPLLVQLFVVFYGLPHIGILIDAFPAAVIVFSINQGAYCAETIRAALESVPPGQLEAAECAGMTWGQSIRRIVLPQALRTAFPPLSNSLIGMVKDTSLASNITVVEMFMATERIVARTAEPLALYIEVGVIYLLFCTVLTKLQRAGEKRLRVYG